MATRFLKCDLARRHASKFGCFYTASREKQLSSQATTVRTRTVRYTVDAWQRVDI